jgi:nicotinate-nucleotide adenylyltransferase
LAKIEFDMLNQERLRIGVFGGTFDPPHLAHLILADEARFQLDLSLVLWVLTPNSPLKNKREISPWKQRYELLNAALRDNQYFQISMVDIDRPAPHYTYETLHIINQEYTDDDIIFLMGGDSLRDLPEWKNPQEILTNCIEIGVMQRPGFDMNLIELERVIPGLQEKIVWVDAPLLEISGSEIRSRLKNGKPVKYFLPPDVYNIIETERYYHSRDEE